MSSPYAILNNRPIDQWKVTELKEELKRRRLMTKGLKEDLIKRLDEALQVEKENAKEDDVDDINCDPQPEGVVEDTAKTLVDDGDLEAVPALNDSARTLVDDGDLEAVPALNDSAKTLVDDGDLEAVPALEDSAKTLVDNGDLEAVPALDDSAKNLVEHDDSQHEKVSDGMAEVDDDESTVALCQGTSQPEEILDVTESYGTEEVVKTEEEVIVEVTTVETTTTVSEVVVSEIPSSVQDMQNGDMDKHDGHSKTQLENEDCEPQLEILDSKPPHKDVMLDPSIPNNQVSEVSPVLGFQVKSDSISTDSVSINEKNELKGNIIADNVKLELDVVKLEMGEPPFSNVVPDGGESHPMDDEEPHGKKVFVEENDKSKAMNSDMSKKNDTVDVCYSEKLNLDRSSGDDSMEEDVSELKQIDSKSNFDEVEDKSVQTDAPVLMEEVSVDVVGDDLSVEKKDICIDDKKSAVPMDKRKLHDQEAVGNNEPSKRQRRWNTESRKVPEPQSSNVTLSTTPKDIFQPRRNYSRSDSTNSEDTMKERVVPPSSKPPTNSLKIERFLRPFTLKAVQELLGKTGSISSFWMDHIKTHCYVTYSSAEEAIETRNAVYNLHWPQNGGRQLLAEFVDPEEVKMRVETPLKTPAAPVSAAPSVPPAPHKQPQPSPRQQVLRQQLPPPPSLPPPPPLSNPPTVRERLTLPPPPPLPDNFDPPIVTLDDLFRKTKAIPRIYYLPLSEEQVAVKVAARGEKSSSRDFATPGAAHPHV